MKTSATTKLNAIDFMLVIAAVSTALTGAIFTLTNLLA
ncbi:hypothetical protein BH23VER1_BH23VER1_26800 [soil metagenome]